MTSETRIVLLFAVSVGVATVARRLRVPYTVALVVAGLILGGLRVLPAPHLTKELLYTAFLPGLIFEAAFHLEAGPFWRNKVAIFGLAVPGVALAIAATAGALVCTSRAFALGRGFGWEASLVFAALASATDPIAVVALFKTLGAPHRLGLVLEAESLANDGTAVVFYTLAVRLSAGSQVGAWGAMADFVRVVALGILVGAVVGFAIALLIARIDDPLVQITLTTIAAYGSFILGEHLHLSGILATAAAGMLCGNYGRAEASRAAVEAFWDYLAFALNSIVFLLIGFEVSGGRLTTSWYAIGIAYAVVMAARAAVVFGVSALVRRTSERLPWTWSVVLTWGGLRGALSMVLALALPESFPGRESVIRVTYGVVLVSIVGNGLTVGPLLRRLGLGAISRSTSSRASGLRREASSGRGLL